MATVRQVRQTDFTAAKGNSLQACIASLQGVELDTVPNFILDPAGYMAAINRYLAPQGLTFEKITLTANGSVPADASRLPPGSAVVLRGKSPRGDFGHVVVARVEASGEAFEPIMDPHPDDTFLDGPGQWAGVLVPTTKTLVVAARTQTTMKEAKDPTFVDDMIAMLAWLQLGLYLPMLLYFLWALVRDPAFVNVLQGIGTHVRTRLSKHLSATK
ncbi:hypothetical protein SDRG_05573 [Saprolegnia diclina VS20]|uniref:Uncharacterized protein n=1 Tax=Saprolegnia diclina (strain VS20) TaxID=1156394 RepID=T0QRJ9_SAPDV|nr:hypothetical protein SDRG_05573 [Saprolegnia diclina VS20]EQC37356.1 hypothetical protein SDRG_05573 [Saprolegnia diclina VS20]|eukprot:XP_008609518.1 hypothetical protein SDRG_05573 [Saprolegnia diclina VS20]